MLLALGLASLLAAAAAAPLVYDQRQDGKVNVAADVQNVVFVFAIPQKMSLPLDIFEDFLKSKKQQNRKSGAQDRADHAIEAFVEPSTPYRVEIGNEGEGRAVEVVIAGRRRSGPEPQAEADGEEIKLIGATEQCGPERERDPVTLACRARADSAHAIDLSANTDAQPDHSADPQPDHSTDPQPEHSTDPQPDHSKPEDIPQQAPEVVPS